MMAGNLTFGSALARRRIIAGLVVLGGVVWLAWPGLATTLRTRAIEQAIAGGRLDAASARLDLWIAEEPAQMKPRLLRVEVARKLGRITEAEDILQRAMELGLPVELGRREHALLLAGQDFGRAEPLLRRWLRDNPTDREVQRAIDQGTAEIARSGVVRK